MKNKEKIIHIIAKQLGKKITEVTDDKLIMKDLGADSLDTVELIMSFDEEFNIDIVVPEGYGKNGVTVNDIITLVESYIK